MSENFVMKSALWSWNKLDMIIMIYRKDTYTAPSQKMTIATEHIK